MDAGSGTGLLDTAIAAGVGAVAGLVVSFVREAIAGAAWERRERWRFKAQTYRRLLRTLQSLALLEGRIDVIVDRHPDTSVDEMPEDERRKFKALLKDIVDHAIKLRTEFAVAQLWIGKETTRVIEALIDQMSKPEVREERLGGLLATARKEILMASREDLKLKTFGP